jgi:hypothetical protein
LNDFSLANALAARYDTVTIRVSLACACFGIVSDDPDKTCSIGDSQSAGLFFYLMPSAFLSPASIKPETDKKKLRQICSETHFEPRVKIKI